MVAPAVTDGNEQPGTEVAAAQLRWSGAPEGRDLAGRFERGNQFGAGNPTLKRLHAMRKAAMEAVTPEEFASLIRKQLGLAMDGDTMAARFVAEYVAGKPVQAVSLENDNDGLIQINVIRTTPLALETKAGGVDAD